MRIQAGVTCRMPEYIAPTANYIGLYRRIPAMGLRVYKPVDELAGRLPDHLFQMHGHVGGKGLKLDHAPSVSLVRHDLLMALGTKEPQTLRAVVAPGVYSYNVINFLATGPALHTQTTIP